MPDDTGDTGPEPTPPTPSTPGAQDTPWADPEAARAEIEKLRREAAGHRTKVRELEPLAKKAQEAEEASKTEVQRALERAEAAERRALEAELANLRVTIAQKHGIPASQAKRLQGANEAELEADALEFAKEMNANPATNGKPKVDTKQGDRGSSPAPDAEAWLRKMVGRHN